MAMIRKVFSLYVTIIALLQGAILSFGLAGSSKKSRKLIFKIDETDPTRKPSLVRSQERHETLLRLHPDQADELEAAADEVMKSLANNSFKSVDDTTQPIDDTNQPTSSLSSREAAISSSNKRPQNIWSGGFLSLFKRGNP